MRYCLDRQLYLNQLREKYEDKPLYVFMDNLSVHTCADSAKTMAELDIVPLWNVPYSPQLNPIESVFNHVKRHFKQTKLHLLSNEKKVDVLGLIKQSFAAVTEEQISAATKTSFRLFITRSSLDSLPSNHL